MNAHTIWIQNPSVTVRHPLPAGAHYSYRLGEELIAVSSTYAPSLSTYLSGHRYYGMGRRC